MRISDWSSDVCSSDLHLYIIHTILGIKESISNNRVMVNLGCFYRVWKMAMVISIRLPLMPGIPKPTTAGYVDCSDDMSHDSNLRFFLEESRCQLYRALGFASLTLLVDLFLGIWEEGW